MVPRPAATRAAAAILWLSVAVAAPAQRPAPVDPYTQGDAAAMRAAGYVSFGPFPFGEDHTSEDVEDLLGDAPLLWVETAHFRLGCAASEVELSRVPTAHRRTLRAELKRLHERLPTVKPGVAALDPWLRTHLIAQRLEELYERIRSDLGFDEAGFAARARGVDPLSREYPGEGPYLGMAEKYSVLIVRRHASMARYTRLHAGHEWGDTLRLVFARYGGLAVCLSEVRGDGFAVDDEALHAYLAYNVAVNLIQGYRSYRHDLPAWLTHGLAHWYSRGVCPRYPIFERKLGGTAAARESDYWQWDEYALALLKNDLCEPLATFLERTDATRFELDQHVQAWFLVDYLMHARKAQLMRFLHRMKDPLPRADAATLRAQVLDRQQIRFEEVFGCAPAALEAEWRDKTRGLRHRR